MIRRAGRAVAGPVLPPLPQQQWSLGLRIATRDGALCYGDGSSAPGANADIAVYPRSAYTVIVLANRGHPHALNVAGFIGARLPTDNRSHRN